MTTRRLPFGGANNPKRRTSFLWEHPHAPRRIPQQIPPRFSHRPLRVHYPTAQHRAGPKAQSLAAQLAALLLLLLVSLHSTYSNATGIGVYKKMNGNSKQTSNKPWKERTTLITTLSCTENLRCHRINSRHKKCFQHETQVIALPHLRWTMRKPMRWPLARRASLILQVKRIYVFVQWIALFQVIVSVPPSVNISSWSSNGQRWSFWNHFSSFIIVKHLLEETQYCFINANAGSF